MRSYKHLVKSGDEKDAFSKYWRKVLHWQKGELKKIKRLFNKRVRKEKEKEFQNYLDDI